MRDTRSFEIKKLIKKNYPNAVVQVRINKYSMGESINIKTDLISRDRIEDPRGYGYTNPYTVEGKANYEALTALLHEYESVDRDQFGEILSGGNTYLFIDSL